MKSIAQFGLGLLIIFLAGTRNHRLLDLRESYGLNEAPPLENASPIVAFTTVALGGFRGIIADALWLRAMDMQDKGQYFEMVQLANWITKLEPRIPDVWAYHAWNLSYNISALFNNPADRWRWVNHGIQLLRDEGLKHNPYSSHLYWELGWIYQHKIGMDFDYTHAYYKQQLAQEMATALEAPESEQRLNKMGLDPEIMQTIDKLYGPLDWRAPSSLSLYYAYRGLQTNPDDFNRQRLTRMIFQNVNQALRTGSLRPLRSGLVGTPNTNLISNAQQAYENAILEEKEPGIQDSLRNHHNVFLSEAIRFFYSQGKRSRAEELYQELVQRYPNTANQQGMETLIRIVVAGPGADLDHEEDRSRIIQHLTAEKNQWQREGAKDLAQATERIIALFDTHATHP